MTNGCRNASEVRESLGRCLADPDFLDIFYGNFLGSSPKVREKFAGTDFDRQKEMLRASFDTMLKAARDEENGPETWLGRSPNGTEPGSSGSAPSSTTSGSTAS